MQPVNAMVDWLGVGGEEGGQKVGGDDVRWTELGVGQQLQTGLTTTTSCD